MHLRNNDIYLYHVYCERNHHLVYVMQEVYLDNQDLLTYKAKNEEERKSGTAVEAQIGCY